jgi:hypothetical protein
MRMTSKRDRVRYLVIAAAIALSLIAGSPTRIVGDGGEYLALALNFASLHGPAIGTPQVAGIEQRIGAIDPILADWQIPDSAVQGPDGRWDFLHFWFYSLLATPGVWLSQATGLPPTAAFTMLNLALLGLALWMALPRLGGSLSLLIFGGPIIWWIDKAHTEAFTFSLLIVAIVLMREAPWWAMVAAGAAATQNPPIALLAGLIGVVSLVGIPGVLRDRRFLAGAAAGLALAAMHPLYYLLRYHTLSLLLRTTQPGTPTLPEITATVLDPDMGLAANAPVFVLVVVGALGLIAWRRRRDLVAVDVLVTAACAIAFLYSFAQASNVHHGATPSMSRYALWLVPLAIPLLRRATEVGRAVWGRFLRAGAVASFVVCLFAFHPGVPQHAHEPTLAADYLWTRHPGWDNPLPEVFVETMLQVEQPWLPVATGGCEKILLGGRGDAGAWPIPCFPEPIPEACRVPGALCYANRTGARYDFVPAPGRRDRNYLLRRDAVWPAGAVPHVRAFLHDWSWWTLTPVPAGVDALRAATDVHVSTLAGHGRFVFVLRDAGPDAALRLRLPGPMTGVLMDAETGLTLSGANYDGPAEGVWELPLPHTSDLMVLGLQSVAKS